MVQLLSSQIIQQARIKYIHRLGSFYIHHLGDEIYGIKPRAHSLALGGAVLPPLLPQTLYLTARLPPGFHHLEDHRAEIRNQPNQPHKNAELVKADDHLFVFLYEYHSRPDRMDQHQHDRKQT